MVHTMDEDIVLRLYLPPSALLIFERLFVLFIIADYLYDFGELHKRSLVGNEGVEQVQWSYNSPDTLRTPWLDRTQCSLNNRHTFPCMFASTIPQLEVMNTSASWPSNYRATMFYFQYIHPGKGHSYGHASTEYWWYGTNVQNQRWRIIPKSLSKKEKSVKLQGNWKPVVPTTIMVRQTDKVRWTWRFF